jgi:hypothetical protein
MRRATIAEIEAAFEEVHPKAAPEVIAHMARALFDYGMTTDVLDLLPEIALDMEYGVVPVFEGVH